MSTFAFNIIKYTFVSILKYFYLSIVFLEDFYLL